MRIELLWYEGIIDWFSDGNLYVDSGYQGILEDFSIKKLFISHKKAHKTKDNPKPNLSDEQREYNKELSKTRVLVEHAIGSIKVFNILNHQFRNKKHYLEDKAISIAPSLHNLSY